MAQTTVGDLIDRLASYDRDLPILIEETGEGAVGYEIQDHGIVNGHVVLVFDNALASEPLT